MRVTLAAATVVALACGAAHCGSSTSPSTLAGAWAGVIQYTMNGVTAQQNLAMSLAQQGTSVTGIYSVNSSGYFAAGNRTMQGSAATSFTGTFQFVSTANPISCTGSFELTGPATGNSVAWTSTTTSSSCGADFTPTTIVMNLTRQ